MDNLGLWNSWSKPPSSVLRQFNNGQYSGTDISPQWRYKVLTEKYGSIGIGWYYTIDKQWTEPGANGAIMAMANISLFVKDGDSWSAPIVGTGGNELVTYVKSKQYLKSSDEGYKMAVTDALSVACKMLGIGADIYLGNWDGSKYKNEPIDTGAYDKEVETIKAEILTYQISDDQKKWVNSTTDLVKLKQALKAIKDKPVQASTSEIKPAESPADVAKRVFETESHGEIF